MPDFSGRQRGAVPRGLEARGFDPCDRSLLTFRLGLARRRPGAVAFDSVLSRGHGALRSKHDPFYHSFLSLLSVAFQYVEERTKTRIWFGSWQSNSTASRPAVFSVPCCYFGQLLSVHLVQGIWYAQDTIQQREVHSENVETRCLGLKGGLS